MKAPAQLALVAVAFALSGCIATKYQFAPPDQPPSVTLDLRPARSPVDIHLDAIVSRGAPGSWKRDALWDEYEVFVANRTPRRWQIESATLVADSGRLVPAGDDPWKLEDLTADWWRQNGVDAAHDIVWGFGQATNVAATAVALAGVTVLQLGALARPDMAIQVIGVVGAAAAVPKTLKAPADANLKSKEDISAEFQRRRHALLKPLPSGGETRGSAFFPITSAPRQLILVCRSGEETRTVTINLPAVLAPSADAGSDAGTRDGRPIAATLSQ